MNITRAIQVCADISSPETKRRELDGLQQAMAKYRLQEGLLLTLEHEGEVKDKNITIRPVWAWLLE